jgi:hypothetical protein
MFKSQLGKILAGNFSAKPLTHLVKKISKNLAGISSVYYGANYTLYGYGS